MHRSAGAALDGEGLHLRPFRVEADEDAAFLCDIANDEASRRWSPSLRGIRTGDDARGWMRTRIGDAGRIEWLVEEPSGRAVGRVGLRVREPLTEMELGYWTLPSARGSGTARRAARAASRYAHTELGIHRVVLLHDVGNPASCRVACAASFRVEGTLVEAFDDGDYGRSNAHLHAHCATDGWDPRPAPVGTRVPNLAGDGIRLRAMRLSDGLQVLAAQDDPLTAAWNPAPFSDETSAARQLTANLCEDTLVWAVDDDQGNFTGTMVLHSIDRKNLSAEVGYTTQPMARGRGIAVRSLALASRYAFEELGLVRVDLFHAVGNSASCRVAQKAGFVDEGTSRQSYRYGDGLLHDEHQHARLATDSLTH